MTWLYVTLNDSLQCNNQKGLAENNNYLIIIKIYEKYGRLLIIL